VAERALEESRRYQAEIASKVVSANKRLGKRIRDQGMEIEYFPDNDKLYVTFGEPRASEAIPVSDGTHGVLLLDPATYEITGVEAPFFMEDLAKLKDESSFWHEVHSLIKKSGNHVYVPPEGDYQRAEKAFMNLLPAS
jgi:hypothetical protein